MKLIKLHTRSDGDAVYINPEHIVSIWKFNEGSCVKTVIDINANNSFDVKESPEQIIEKIENAREWPAIRWVENPKINL